MFFQKLKKSSNFSHIFTKIISLFINKKSENSIFFNKTQGRCQKNPQIFGKSTNLKSQKPEKRPIKSLT